MPACKSLEVTLILSYSGTYVFKQNLLFRERKESNPGFDVSWQCLVLALLVWHYLLTSYSWDFSGNFRQRAKAGSHVRFGFKVSRALQQAFLTWWLYLSQVRLPTQPRLGAAGQMGQCPLSTAVRYNWEFQLSTSAKIQLHSGVSLFNLVCTSQYTSGIQKQS